MVFVYIFQSYAYGRRNTFGLLRVMNRVFPTRVQLYFFCPLRFVGLPYGFDRRFNFYFVVGGDEVTSVRLVVVKTIYYMTYSFGGTLSFLFSVNTSILIGYASNPSRFYSVNGCVGYIVDCR